MEIAAYTMWLLSDENCSHGVFIVCWTLCVNSVVLIVNSRFNCEEFSSDKTISHSAVPAFISQRLSFSLQSLWCFRIKMRFCLFLVLWRGIWRLFFKLVLIDAKPTFMPLAICRANHFGFHLTLSRKVLITFFVRAVRGLPPLDWMLLYFKE